MALVQPDTEIPSGDPEAAPDALRWLADLLRAPNPDFAAIAAEDWDSLIALACDHFVIGELAERAESQPALLPPSAAEMLEGVRVLSRERGARMACELESVSALLNQAGVVPVMLKGAAYLACDPAGRARLRLSNDLDILVHADDLTRATAALTAQGYQPHGETPRLRHHHLPSFIAEGQTFPIELHERPLNWIVRGRLTTDEMIAKARPMAFGAARVLVPSATHLVLHSILHAQFGARQFWTGFQMLRDHFDLLDLVTREGDAIDWPEIARRFEQIGLGGALAFHLELFRQLFDIEIPCPARFTPSGRAALAAHEDPSAPRPWLLWAHHGLTFTRRLLGERALLDWLIVMAERRYWLTYRALNESGHDRALERALVRRVTKKPLSA
ncbi:MAG: hypothetical protein GC199_02340 [Alphaproteobacteria bacterium]|nr:hypothetical protein [Alphaproteobacteria bacterium]